MLSWQADKSSPKISSDFSNRKFQISNRIPHQISPKISQTHFCRLGSPKVFPWFSRGLRVRGDCRIIAVAVVSLDLTQKNKIEARTLLLQPRSVGPGIAILSRLEKWLTDLTDYYQGPLKGGGVSNGGVSRSGLVLTFFDLFGTFPDFWAIFRDFPNLSGDSGDFPDWSFSSFSAY